MKFTRAIKSLFYCFYLIALFSLLALWAVERYKKEFFPPDEDLFKLNIKHMMTDLGWLAMFDRKNSYKNYSQDKSADVVRVAFLGDSFVEGMEVKDGNDVVSIAQRLLDEIADAQKYELINFGVCGYGLHQLMMMWEDIAVGYNIDQLVIMELLDDWDRRDSSFGSMANFSLDLSLGLYTEGVTLHARYESQNGKLQRLPILGKDLYESYKKYWTFFSPYYYFKDNYYPLGLRAPIYYLSARKLTGQKKIFNKALLQNLKETRKRIIETISSQVNHIYYVVNSEELFEMVKDYQIQNMQVIKLSVDREAYNYQIAHHYSPLANLKIAQTLTEKLTKKKIEVYDYKVKHVNFKERKNKIAQEKGLDLDELYVELGSTKVAKLYNLIDNYDPQLNCTKPDCENNQVFDLQNKKLVLLSHIDESTYKQIYTAIPNELMETEIVVNFYKGRRIIATKRIKLNKISNVLSQARQSIDFDLEMKFLLLDPVSLGLKSDSIRAANKVEFKLGQQLLLHGKREKNRFRLDSPENNVYVIRGLQEIDYSELLKSKEKALLKMMFCGYKEKQKILEIEIAELIR